MNNSALHLFICHTEDMSSEMEMFMSQVVPELQDLVESDGHYLVVVNFPHENDLQVAMLLS